jgi:putative ABC transport system permease protein
VCLQTIQREKIRYRSNVANDITVYAVTSDFENTRSFEISNGRYFSSFEASSGKNVILLGSVIAERLFDKEDPVGKTITVSGFRASVIGVIKKEGKGGISDSGFDEATIVPMNFARSFINMRNKFLDMTLIIKAKNDVPVQELSDEAKMIIRASRRLKPDQIDDFSINRSSLISQGFDAVFAGINLGGWVIGGFAILVGGFGIANIMFVSVRERTNIIGIQKALGAKKQFILQQFLFESVLLSITGGLIGLFLILIGTVGINYFYELNMHLTVGNTVLALVISSMIGVVAGYAPANAAAKMDPVEAIGYSF